MLFYIFFETEQKAYQLKPVLSAFHLTPNNIHKKAIG